MQTLNWFKVLQGVTNDLPTAARIILEQNPRDIEWANRRLREFAGVLSQQKPSLVPISTSNGIDWSQRRDDDPNDLVYFDHFYGAGSIELRLGIQLLAAPNPNVVFESKLTVTGVESGKEPHCTGEISLRARRGHRWVMSVHMPTHGHNVRRDPVLRRFSYCLAFDRMDTSQIVLVEGTMTGKHARDAFLRMAKCVSTA
ncbi:hypothetical protein HY480_04340 [Candidatus Uhrbacteria bacterium]|nr:hypothetical protein [Candidatus Uhrbacteria bacterium]